MPEGTPSPGSTCPGPNCFVAGTQVVVAVLPVSGSEEDEPLVSTFGTDGGTALAAAPARTVRYVTRPIEAIGAGDWVVARDQHDPDGGAMLRQVEAAFVRRALHLTAVTLRSSTGAEQVLRTTAEHPVYVPGRGWVDCRELEAGDELLEPSGGRSTVVSAVHERHPAGVAVYNVWVAQSHTYFVREGGTVAEPVWVHNYDVDGEVYNSDGTPTEDDGGGAAGKMDASTDLGDADGDYGYYQPSNQESLDTGNYVHYDQLNGSSGEQLPSALQNQYPDTEFYFPGRGETGPDATVLGGTHPSEYPGSTWDPGNAYGDFKPGNDSGLQRFNEEVQSGKLPPNTQYLPYNPATGEPEW